MKLLPDEQVPKRLAEHFPDNYSIHTAQLMGWSSAKNGELLQLAAENEIDRLLIETACRQLTRGMKLSGRLSLISTVLRASASRA